MFANSKFHLTWKMVADIIENILSFSYILMPIQLMGLSVNVAQCTSAQSFVFLSKAKCFD